MTLWHEDLLKTDDIMVEFNGMIIWRFFFSLFDADLIGLKSAMSDFLVINVLVIILFLSFIRTRLVLERLNRLVGVLVDWKLNEDSVVVAAATFTNDTVVDVCFGFRFFSLILRLNRKLTELPKS